MNEDDTHPIWIIENLLGEDSFIELSDSAKSLADFEVIDIKGDYKVDDLKHIKGRAVLINGSINMVKLIGDQMLDQDNCVCTYNSFEPYLCSKFYGPLGKYLFNDKYAMVPLSELNRQKYFFYGTFGKEALMFIRPDSGEKTFKAGLVDLQDFDKFYDQFEHCKDDLVIVSSPKTIRGEWRFVVNDMEEIISQSSYRYHGQSVKIQSAPRGATELCQQILKEKYFPDRVFCIDICEDNDGNFWLMELTSFSSAGLYACNMDRVTMEVSKMALGSYLDFLTQNVLHGKYA